MSEKSIAFMPKGTTPAEVSKITDDYKKFRLLGDLAGRALGQEVFREHDEMTGLLTKNAWKQRVRAAIKSGNKFGILFIDLNDFKELNDKQGHQEGDKQLIKVAQVLEKATRKSRDPESQRHPDSSGHERLYEHTTSNGRFGGDEFVVLFDDIDSLNNFDAAKGRLEKEFKENGISAAVGDILHQEGMSESELYKLADQAMYKDKQLQKQQEITD